MSNETSSAFSPRDVFQRQDDSNDDNFYAFPRLVTHIDDAAIAVVTNLYREFFPAGGAILDLMSSWVSHLPEEADYCRVVGLGMNAEELDANPRLSERIVQNLNSDPYLPFDEAEFDGAAICVSVQYLIKPDLIFKELARVLKPNAPLVVSFSNRCFPTKAVFIWQVLDDEGHAALVREYFVASEGYNEPEIRQSQPRSGDPLFAVIGKRKND